MNIFDYAMKMEKDGESYYREMASRTRIPGLQTILTMLAEEEVKHYNIFAAIRDEQPELADTSILTEAKNIFAEMKDKGEELDLSGDQKHAYEQAKEIERKSRDFYIEKSREVSDPYQKSLLTKIAAEEEKHWILLDNIVVLLSRPQIWLENAEWYHLDAY